MKIRIKYVHFYTDQRGRPRAYFRRKGFERWPLRLPAGTPEFWADYEAAARGEVPPGVADREELQQPIKPHSLRWLCVQYKKSPAFKRLAPRTRRVRANILDDLCIKHGAKPFRMLRTRHVRRIRDDHADRPEAANARVKALRQLFTYAVEYDLVDVSPARDVPYLKSNNPDGFHAWTLEEVAQFEEAHPVGTKPRLALALLLYTAQRRSDIALLGKQHLKNGRLVFTQTKNRDRNPVRLSIPVLSELQRILDASPTGDMTFLVTSFGKPFTAAGFGNWFREQCDKAGLPQCSAHGVRKASAARMAELGCTAKEIQAITGHKTLKEIERYTESARQQTLADAAVAKIEAAHRANREQKVANHAKKLAKKPK